MLSISAPWKSVRWMYKWACHCRNSSWYIYYKSFHTQELIPSPSPSNLLLPIIDLVTIQLFIEKSIVKQFYQIWSNSRKLCQYDISAQRFPSFGSQLCCCTWVTSIDMRRVQNFIVWLKGPKSKHCFRWDLLCYTSSLSISKLTVNRSNQPWHLPFYTVHTLYRYSATRSIYIHLVRWLNNQTPYISTISTLQTK